MENFDAAIAYIDENGKCLFLNRTAAAWLNGEPEDYVGKTVYDTFPKDLADTYVERLRRGTRSGVGETIEEVVEPSNRRVFSHLQPVRNNDGEIMHVQIVTYDITKHNRIGEDLGKD